MSRRRSNRVRISKAVTAPPLPIITEIHVCSDDEQANHRTCWKHLASSFCNSNTKPTDEDFDKFKLNAPCFFDECKRRERSVRRIKCKHLVSKLKKKMNSNTFSNYLEEIWRGFADEKKDEFMYLDCLWFSMYKSENHRIRNNVFESIKKKKIFTKKYVFLPIVYWSHWNLLILCNFGDDLESDTENACMLLLDSLQTADSCRLEPDIRKFVLDIYRLEGRTDDTSLVNAIPLLVAEVPQQTNDVECGSFVLYYIYRFIQDAPENFDVDDFPYFMKEDWFSHEDLEEFCNKLYSLGTIR